ncbi:MAG: hypothetical protein V4694_05940 [Pseudomonadota bacterium]
MKKIISLFLVFVAISCAKKPITKPVTTSPASKKEETISRKNEINQKLLHLIDNLSKSVNKLSCDKDENWEEAKEKSRRLLWKMDINDPRLSSSKEFLSTLETAQKAEGKECESSLAILKSDIADFKKTIPVQKTIQKVTKKKVKKSKEKNPMKFMDRFF